MHPIQILPAWLLELVSDVINKQSTYTNPLAKKGFVLYRSEEDMNIKATPLLRILGFCKAHSDGRLTAILHDASHKILVCFSRESLIKYENKHLERLTYMSINSILIVKEASLRFITITQLPQLLALCPVSSSSPVWAFLCLR